MAPSVVISKGAPPAAAPGLLLHGLSRPPQQELQFHGGELQGGQAVAGERRPVRFSGQCTGQGEERRVRRVSDDLHQGIMQEEQEAWQHA